MNTYSIYIRFRRVPSAARGTAIGRLCDQVLECGGEVTEVEDLGLRPYYGRKSTKYSKENDERHFPEVAIGQTPQAWDVQLNIELKPANVADLKERIKLEMNGMFILSHFKIEERR